MPRLCIVTALPAESRALLDALKLRHSNTRHLRLYSSEQYLLLETGSGKLNAAACVAALLQSHPDISAVANVGIAGGNFDYAQILTAHHVRDRASGVQWYPHLPDDKLFRTTQSASVESVDTPDANYRDGVLFDMEAAGIFNAASRYLSTSQIHSMKVVSDNANCSINDITKDTVINIISQSLPVLLPMLNVLHEQNKHIPLLSSAGTDDLIGNTTAAVHHSVNDQQMLRQLVQQYVALTGELPMIDAQADTAKSIRQTLTATLAKQPFTYGEI